MTTNNMLLAAVLCALCSGAAFASTPVDALQCPVPATGRSFANQDLKNENFHAYPKGSLRYADFHGAKLKGAIFIGVDLTGANFRDADLGPSEKGPANFSEATLDKTCFIGATMNATIFTFARLKCADFSGTSLVQADFGPRQYIDYDAGCRTRFVGSTLDVHAIKVANPNKSKDHLASDWAKTDFTDANFLELRPATFSLAGKDITGAMLAGTNFSGVDMRKANLTGVDFRRAVLTSIRADDATLNGAKLRNARVSAASFRCARFFGSKNDTQDNPNSKECKDNPQTTTPLASADFTQATLVGAHFERATLNNATFTGASLINASLQAQNGVGAATVSNASFAFVNFRNAQLSGVHFNDDVLTGAIFDRTTQSATQYLRSVLPATSWDTATLQGVSFQYAVLENAQFTNTTIQTGPESTNTDFTCARLGGANFSGASVTAAVFQYAVMPAAGDCCPQTAGVPWCGTIAATGDNYGPVTFPVLHGDVTCPDGTVTTCQGDHWRVPDWRTPCGGSSRVAWQKPCDVAPVGSVTFSDDNLRRCILDNLGGVSSITLDKAKAITEVNCVGKQIASTGGLEKFTGLTKLDLSANALTNFSLALPNLQTLLLSSNQLTALDVSGLPNLFRLEAANNQLQDVAGLGIVSPTTLDLSHNRLSAVNLTGQANLVSADLSHNVLKTILSESHHDLKALTALQSLNLESNQLATIGPLDALGSIPAKDNSGNLRALFLSCNPAFDCASLHLDGQYPAYQQSGCAQFDVLSSQWQPLPHPSCSAQP